MLFSIEGEEACGKTTLAYTAPRKIVGFAFDMGAERAIYGTQYKELFSDLEIQFLPYDGSATVVPQWAEHDITIYELPQPIQLDTIAVAGCEQLWDYFIQLMVAAIRDDSVRSIVLDTATLARRIKADAYLQNLQQKATDGKIRERLLQIEYGATNDAIRSIYTTMAGVKKNLVAIHHLTDERKETIDAKGAIVQALTGNRILEGLTQTYRFFDIAVRNTKEKGELTTTLTKCGYNLSLEGIPVQDATWDKLSQMIENSLGGTLKLERANG